MSKSKLLLVDKDGTIVTPTGGRKFVTRPWQQEPLSGAKAAIAHYHSNGWKAVIISNQAGVEAGYKTLESCTLEMHHALELFPEIQEAFFCPVFDGSECYQVWRKDIIAHGAGAYQTWELNLQGKYRKPNPGMLLLAQAIYGANECLMVGDRPEDEGAAQAAGIPFMWAEEWRSPFVD